MPVRNDDNPLDRTDPEGIDDLLAQDRDLLARAADERIAGGMYARIAHAHAERKVAAGWRWQWQLAIASLACAVLVAVWFALPIAALAICIVEPTAAQSAVKAIQAWTARHARAITLVVSFAVGGTLVIHGALTI